MATPWELLTNAPALALRTPEVLAQMRAQQAQKEAQAQQQQQMLAMAKAGRDGASAVSDLSTANASGLAQQVGAAGFSPQQLPEAA